jgi:hypothetical protein
MGCGWSAKAGLKASNAVASSFFFKVPLPGIAQTESTSFLKKEAKNFLLSENAGRNRRESISKSLSVLFFRKELLSSFYR